MMKHNLNYQNSYDSGLDVIEEADESAPSEVKRPKRNLTSEKILEAFVQRRHGRAHLDPVKKKLIKLKQGQTIPKGKKFKHKRELSKTVYAQSEVCLSKGRKTSSTSLETGASG